jgi:diadenosine tetraphosphate (Ap4A) HIT family hydrolase
MPDKFPITPGHTLIISKEHLACYGAAPADLHAELEEVAGTVQQFLHAAYGQPLFVWENGISGQSVYHAHLHLIPFPGAAAATTIPAEIGSHPDVNAIAGWADVRDHFAAHRSYRYLHFAGERQLLAGHSPVIRSLVRWMSEGTGLRYESQGWIKTTTPEDVAEVGRRWQSWGGSLSVR